MGTILCNSSSSETNSALGLLEKAPTSINVAPSLSIFPTFDSISLSFLYFPPSKKELGVTFKIPITLGVDKSTSCPLQFIVIFK